MTRMAPTPRTTSRNASVELSASTHVVSARWRLGLRGTLTLVIHEAGRDGVARATASIVRSRDAAPRVAELHAHLDASDCDAAEARWLLTSMDESKSVSARAALVRTATLDAGHLLLTDLPEALGLQGGTYVLESLDVTPEAM